ncbi:MAG: tRNA (adenosine(37)-N6)-threonylcarbamoyltransferase complex dimerization subunit type 1 TsaB [bacterium]|nr:tRNA (adenosine(37)-N6)-threonylcarbamoyltransferase complex dimerization subunit type 1 TsaB [bacterium]
MKTLYFNTATQTTAIALFADGKVVAERRWPARFDEAEKLLPAVKELLEEQRLKPEEIDRLACCVGPGGFTSVRVGVSAVNAWSFAKNAPCAALCVFDLYDTSLAIVVAANPNEAWIKLPQEDPIFASRDNFPQLPEKFSFTGILNEDWKKFLQELGGTAVEQEEAFPAAELLEQLEFKQQILKPWYYKDPHITLSKKNT